MMYIVCTIIFIAILMLMFYYMGMTIELKRELRRLIEANKELVFRDNLNAEIKNRRNEEK